ncbi:DUF2807 domain-containing protein [Hymenobacter lutimineralis]|uniref:DUF2807 domain-containing protein n=1 Tax=Hymenobacter lutimineralis TaxID=2606448 RepID=A0A5D6V162_9BACT|nr:head GIN domain-containing protein [Hymenobacter lutimineralis]TYZ09286.1 DUF2807 domain-containing protein [Hymenobacter lutimineralis]
MKTLRLFLLLLTVAALRPFQLLAFQRDVRVVESFQELALGLPAEVILRQGPEQRVEVEAAPEDLKQIETTVKDGRLRIRRPEKGGLSRWTDDYRFKQPVKVYVTMPTVRVLSVSGSGAIVAETPIKASTLKLSMSGSGRLQVNAVTDALTTSISGSGRILVAGSADSNSASISGSGRIEATELRTNTTSVGISGSGNCRVYASKTLDARISGSGSVTYQGSPQVSSRISGSGTVRRG